VYHVYLILCLYSYLYLYILCHWGLPVFVDRWTRCTNDDANVFTWSEDRCNRSVILDRYHLSGSFYWRVSTRWMARHLFQVCCMLPLF